MTFDYNCIIRLENVDMLSSYTIILNFDFSDLDYEMATCFLHSMLHINFASKKIIKICGLIKYSYVKLLIFFWEINCLD